MTMNLKETMERYAASGEPKGSELQAAEDILITTNKEVAEASTLLAETTQASAELLAKETQASAELLARTTQASAEQLSECHRVSVKQMERLTFIMIGLGLM